MNKIILIGRLTKDGEVRTTQNETKIYSNSIAVQRRYKNAEGNYDVDFFNFTLWNTSDNFSQYLTKGKQVLIEGRIQTRKYENDKKETKYVTDVIAEHIELLGNKEEKPKEVVLTDEDIDKVFNQDENLQLPF